MDTYLEPQQADRQPHPEQKPVPTQSTGADQQLTTPAPTPSKLKENLIPAPTRVSSTNMPNTGAGPAPTPVAPSQPSTGTGNLSTQPSTRRASLCRPSHLVRPRRRLQIVTPATPAADIPEKPAPSPNMPTGSTIPKTPIPNTPDPTPSQPTVPSAATPGPDSSNATSTVDTAKQIELTA